MVSFGPLTQPGVTVDPSLQTCPITTLQTKELEKEEYTKPKANRKKELIKMRTKINKLENRRTVEEINKTMSWFFEKMNKIDKPCLD